MTPILDADPGSAEERYTKKHVQARNCIERCFGLLKSRWRCLLKDRVLHYKPYVASKIIIACAVLHNIAIEARLPAPSQAATMDEDEALPIGPDINTSATGGQYELMRGRAVRSGLVDRFR